MNTACTFLTDLLAIPSVNGRDHEGAAAEFLCGYFEAHGILAQVQKIDEFHSNVIAFLPGKDTSETMIWNGHLDTVPYGDLRSWHTDPSVPAVMDGRIYGRGASDMKSGLAAMAFALCDLKEKGHAPSCNILFLGTCDEEKGGLGAEEALTLLREGGPGCGPGNRPLVQTRPFLLVGEPTSLRPGIAQKGCLWLEIRVQGRTSHGAYPEKGTNAVSCGMRLADEIREYASSFTHPVLGSATAQVTRISGGVANNMTPDTCTIVMDIRMVPGLSSKQVISKGQEILEEEAEKHPGLSAAFTPINDRRAIEIDPAHPRVNCLRTLLRLAGQDDTPIGINFFTDASVLDREDQMDICLFGPGDPTLAHQPDEYVEIDRYLEAIRILEEFAGSHQ